MHLPFSGPRRGTAPMHRERELSRVRKVAAEPRMERRPLCNLVRSPRLVYTRKCQRFDPVPLSDKADDRNPSRANPWLESWCACLHNGREHRDLARRWFTRWPALLRRGCDVLSPKANSCHPTHAFLHTQSGQNGPESETEAPSTAVRRRRAGASVPSGFRRVLRAPVGWG
jgi:hypothetical protein